MIDEQTLRQPNFVEGVCIRLANGQAWSLPEKPPGLEDAEHLAVLHAIDEAEDDAERTCAELALTIFLLSRNYALGPRDYEAILTFAPDDPAQAEIQAAVSALARSQLRAVQSRSAVGTNASLPHSAHGRLSNLLRWTGRVSSS